MAAEDIEIMSPSQCVERIVNVLTRADPNAHAERLVSSLREVFAVELDGVKTQFRSRDEAVRLLHDDMVRVPTLLDRAEHKIIELISAQLSASDILRDEKFSAVNLRFVELEKRSKDLDEARATALIAALAAAKELVGVQSTSSAQMIQAANANFTKQIDGLQLSFTTQFASSEDKYTDLKDRFNALAVTMNAAQSTREDHRGQTGMIVGIIGAIGIVISLFMSGATFLHNNAAPPPVYLQPQQPAAR